MVVGAANLEALPDYAEKWPYPFSNSFLHVHLWQWCLIGALFVISFVAGALGRFGTKRIIDFRDHYAAHKMIASTRAALGRSVGFVVGSMFAYVLLPSLRLEETGGRHISGLSQDIRTLVDALIVVSLTMFVFAYWDAACDLIAEKAVGHDRAERLLVPMMRKFVRAIIVICGILIALATVFGTQTLTGLVAGLGVTGLVVALAGKDSVENVFGSLTILFDMPFALGDYVKIDKVEGNVEEINLRSTRIRTPEDTLILLPNANLIRASVENFGARRSRRQRVTVRLSYTSEPNGIDRFCDKIREFINEHENVDGQRTLVQLDDPTEASIGVAMVWYLEATTVQEEAKSRSRVLNEVLKLKRSHGLLLASLPLEAPEIK